MQNKVPVASVGLDGVRTEYPSIKEAAIAVHTSTSMIWRAVNFGHKAKGMRWEKRDGE